MANKIKTQFDVENLSNSGPFFKNLLIKNREMVKRDVVLPAVFEILAKKFAKSKDNSYRETRRSSITWYLPKHKPINKMTGLWKCRLVCKSWNQAIENVLQRKDTVQIVQPWYSNNPIFTTKNEHLAKYANFDLVSNPSKFVKAFIETHYDDDNNCVTKNPFLGRSVTIELLLNALKNPILVEKRNSTSEFLEKWGREIWYCTINHNDLTPRSEEIEFYRSLRTFLVKMPNLKMLSILCESLSLDSGKSEISRLKSEICKSPLPVLPKILYFSCIDLPYPIYNHIRNINNIPKECSYIGA